MPRYSQVFRLIAFTLALCVSQGASAAVPVPSPHYGVFVYSNFCVSPQSGDMYGNRVTLLRSADGTTLFFEYTDGSMHGVVATELKLDTPHDKISFLVQPEGAPVSAVVGKLARDGSSVILRGVPSEGDAARTLARVTNFAEPAISCRTAPDGK